MSEAGIGRIVVASLHQGIADTLPSRLEFYENWLTAAGLRGGTIGVAQLNAVLSFLRREDDAYDTIVRRAGQYAADWTLDSMSGARRRCIEMLPSWGRARMALRVARRLVRRGSVRSRAVVRRGREGTRLEIERSLFCDVREAWPFPLCGFYAAAAARLLDRFDVDGDVVVGSCRGAGKAACVLEVTVRGPKSRHASVVAA
ncbi:MAG TPA: hypothetical protein VND92_04270 [Vicinamibacterales bacterium]|nr:hypothetical protein [Vicinamibacterales bacterium]